MILTVELSMYPLQEGYSDLVLDFIRELNTRPGLHCNTSATSTLIVGEYDVVMQGLTELFAWSNKTHGKAVFVAKFIPDFDAA
ncbi:MAG TPA: hypothetical protein VNR18_03960 [Hyphomicrobiales bacterium]|nr:hypothetical protein [Hyphomicrobiales bacterium]